MFYPFYEKVKFSLKMELEWSQVSRIVTDTGWVLLGVSLQLYVDDGYIMTHRYTRIEFLTKEDHAVILTSLQ